ncbi:hypothetical protein IMW81_25350 [Klebsiella pneumoniae]|uniref:hypothetical protein n=1 Tax=Klebsiella pneumoniae TaxID=573 RepID=UPI000D497466|nr:hypothetical protein [Klebsiella pneumoniae]MBE3275275.1 hypothetical protein [Klebsiella pneumoniae]MBU0216763.1 hypothetical protein [Klebsiella pneumoniae]POI39399.1 hypothetical protein C3E93_11165 [Klebsiella pneumoniae]
MKVLIKLSNDWPEHVSGNPVLDKWVHKIPWSGIECFLLCEDGNVYQSYTEKRRGAIRLPAWNQ